MMLDKPIPTLRRDPKIMAQIPLELINWQNFFGNTAPVEIEIGCGKGKFLLSRAQESPQVNFLGIDWAGKWMGIGRTKSEKQKIANLKFLKTNASEFVLRVPSNSVSAFHIYFPDPWPKRKHRKRRFVSEGSMKMLWEKLIDGGKIEYATDFEDYFAEVKIIAEKTRLMWKNVRMSVNERLVYPHLQTNYEMKYAAEGRTLYYLELEKK